jgi:hypothetical protein
MTLKKEIKLVCLAIPDREHYERESIVIPESKHQENNVTLRLRQENKQNMFHHQKGLLQESVKLILINGRRI